jgi:hypothetical protein
LARRSPATSGAREAEVEAARRRSSAPSSLGAVVSGRRTAGRVTPQQLDQLRRAPEGVGDEVAGSQREHGFDHAVAFGDQSRRRRDGAGIAAGDPADPLVVVGPGKPDRHRLEPGDLLTSGRAAVAAKEVHAEHCGGTDQSKQDVVVNGSIVIYD